MTDCYVATSIPMTAVVCMRRGSPPRPPINAWIFVLSVCCVLGIASGLYDGLVTRS